MLDVVVGIRRLEARLDRLAEREREGATGRWAEPDPGGGGAPRRWGGPGTGGGADAPRQGGGAGGRGGVVRAGEDGGQGGGDAHAEAREARGDQRILLDVIDKVCAGNGRPGALVRQGVSPGPTTAASLRTPACSDPNHPAPEPRAAASEFGLVPVRGLGAEEREDSSAERRRPAMDRDEGQEELGVDVQTTDRKLDALSESLSKKLERIAYSLGIRNLNLVDNSADDAEDRKRLMEKLKSAFDNDRRRRIVMQGNDRDKSLDYFFGICKPDQRIGKRGSRCCALWVIARLCLRRSGRNYIDWFVRRLIHPRSRFASGAEPFCSLSSLQYSSYFRYIPLSLSVHFIFLESQLKSHLCII
jgi:hypothetical protein